MHGYPESDSIPSTRVAMVNKVNLVPSPPEETNNLKINKSNKYCKEGARKLEERSEGRSD